MVELYEHFHTQSKIVKLSCPIGHGFLIISLWCHKLYWLQSHRTLNLKEKGSKERKLIKLLVLFEMFEEKIALYSKPMLNKIM